MDQPIPTPPEQLLAALDTARHMAGHIAPDDLPPGGAEQSVPLAFAAGGLPEVIGVVLRGVPSVDALERIKTTFGGEITVTRRASSASGTQWTEHQLVGMVRGVPYLAEARTDHEPLPPPLPRRERGATVPPDVVLLDVVPQQGTAEHDQADRDEATVAALGTVCRAHGDDCTRDPRETHILGGEPRG